MELLLLRASLARFSERDLEAVLGSSPNPQETEQGNIPGQGLSVSAPKSSEILAAVAKFRCSVFSRYLTEPTLHRRNLSDLEGPRGVKQGIETAHIRGLVIAIQAPVSIQCKCNS